MQGVSITPTCLPRHSLLCWTTMPDSPSALPTSWISSVSFPTPILGICSVPAEHTYPNCKTFYTSGLKFSFFNHSIPVSTTPPTPQKKRTSLFLVSSARDTLFSNHLPLGRCRASCQCSRLI